MQRDGADPDNIDMADILCDFCGQPWTHDRPMVEGHRGSCICGSCLTVAYSELVIARVSSPLEPGEACTLCLERDDDRPSWRGLIREQALACSRCVKQSAGALHKDPDIPWRKPASPTAPTPET